MHVCMGMFTHVCHAPRGGHRFPHMSDGGAAVSMRVSVGGLQFPGVCATPNLGTPINIDLPLRKIFSCNGQRLFKQVLYMVYY